MLRETVVLSWIPTKTIQSLSLRETVVLSLTPTQDNIKPNPKNSSSPEFVSGPRLQNIRLFQDILQDFKAIKQSFSCFLSTP